jgi:hypothetical protein
MRPDVRTSPRRTSREAVVAICLIPFLFPGVIVALFAAPAAVIGPIGPDLERERLAPIPVSPAACPSLAAVRAGAGEPADLWSAGLRHEKPWPAFRDELAVRLVASEGALTDARPRSRGEPLYSAF